MRFFDSPHDLPEGGWLEFVKPDPALEQAIDTVARRLIVCRAKDDDITGDGLAEFIDIGDEDWERVIKRAWVLTQEIDPGKGPFDAAYELLRRRDS